MNIAVEEISESFITPCSRLHAEIFAEIGATEESFRSQLSSERAICLIARDGENVLGYSIFHPGTAKSYWSWLGVSKKVRGQGIGLNLINSTLSTIQASDSKLVEADSRNRYACAIRLYLKVGFQIVGTYLADDGDLMIKLKKHFV